VPGSLVARRGVLCQTLLKSVLMIHANDLEHASESQEGTDLGKAGEKVVRSVLGYDDWFSDGELEIGCLQCASIVIGYLIGDLVDLPMILIAVAEAKE
jgi:hypothetical protein